MKARPDESETGFAQAANGPRVVSIRIATGIPGRHFATA